ncbi:hypothetical protein [Micromonospora sp. ATCC 39149]|uniref:hypothetical protein n=1 Tax=Micromonospora sp. (strain ATCC 39149 / NRRL 15099 / SCC 1413) TaxID=219305 RepID=UPI001E2D034B|nr:hypothetical protein [Micromonospora sp. ATCC 39149]
MEQLDIDADKLVIVTFDLCELLGYVHPVMIRDLDVPALDHDVHVTSLVRTVFDPEIPAGSPSGEPSFGVDRVSAVTPPLTAGGEWNAFLPPTRKR